MAEAMKKQIWQPKNESPVTNSRKRRTFTLRLVFVSSMILAAAVFGVLAFKITENEQRNAAIRTYESITTSALESAQAIVQRKRDGAESLATMWSFAFPSATQWPFVGFRGYEELATDVAKLSSTEGHGFSVLVHRDEVPAFESHAKQLYADYGFPKTAGWSDFGFGIYGIDPSAGYPDRRFHDTSGNTTWGGKNDILVPFLQHKNTYSNPSLLMMNLYQFELRGALVDSMIDCGLAKDPNTTVAARCGAITDFTEIFIRPGPAAVIFNPIFPVNDPATVVGFIGTSIHWVEILTNIVPKVEGLQLDCVVSNGRKSYTYAIDDGVPHLKGEGDQHDRQYDDLAFSTSLSDRETDTEASATFTLTIYPTELMFDEFKNNIPLFSAIGFAAVICVCTCIFFLYDHLMMYEALEQRKIFEIKRRFVKFVSHETRTPLNVVCMGLDLLRTEMRDNLKEEIVKRMISLEERELDVASTRIESSSSPVEYWCSLTEEIVENAQNAVSVLSELLNYDKIQSGTLELELSSVRIWSTVLKTIRDFSLQAKNRRVELAVVLEDQHGIVNDIEEALQGPLGTMYVHGDDRRLAQVVRNLVSNAIKFTPEGKSISITISHQPDGLPHATRIVDEETLTTNGSDFGETDLTGRIDERSGSLVISVADSGVGLTSEQLSLLFTEGVQFNPNLLQAGGGSGLGLCIAKEIVQMHGGIITAHSEGLGMGTTFVVELPLYKSPRCETIRSLVDTSSVQSDTESRLVLVVDDVLTNSKMLMRLLERAGHRCITAANGQEAVERYQAHQEALSSEKEVEPIHTILIDFEMPLMNGPYATKRLRELGCTAYVFGVTGNILAEDVATFKSSGADTVLFKPINLATIDEAWEKVEMRNAVSLK